MLCVCVFEKCFLTVVVVVLFAFVSFVFALSFICFVRNCTTCVHFYSCLLLLCHRIPASTQESNEIVIVPVDEQYPVEFTLRRKDRTGLGKEDREEIIKAR